MFQIKTLISLCRAVIIHTPVFNRDIESPAGFLAVRAELIGFTEITGLHPNHLFILST
jgi:hypothetical protein